MCTERIARWIIVFFVLFTLLGTLQSYACTAWYVAHAVPTGGYVVDWNGGYQEMSFEPWDPIPFEWAWMIATVAMSVISTFVTLRMFDNAVKSLKASKSEKIKIC